MTTRQEADQAVLEAMRKVCEANGCKRVDIVYKSYPDGTETVDVKLNYNEQRLPRSFKVHGGTVKV